MEIKAKKDRVYITCSTCGIELRAKKKHAGRSMTCPKCKAQNTVPFGDMEKALGVKAEKGVAAAEDLLSKALEGGDKKEEDEPPLGGSGGPSGAQTATIAGLDQNIQEIENLLRSVYRVLEDCFARAQSILKDPALNAEKKEAELVRLRRDLAGGMRNEVSKTQATIDEKVDKLRNHPMSKSAKVMAQLKETEQVQAAYTLFAKCVFDVKPQENGAPAAGK